MHSLLVLLGSDTNWLSSASAKSLAPYKLFSWSVVWVPFNSLFRQYRLGDRKASGLKKNLLKLPPTVLLWGASPVQKEGRLNRNWKKHSSSSRQQPSHTEQQLTQWPPPWLYVPPAVVHSLPWSNICRTCPSRTPLSRRSHSQHALPSAPHHVSSNHGFPQEDLVLEQLQPPTFHIISHQHGCLPDTHGAAPPSTVMFTTVGQRNIVLVLYTELYDYDHIWMTLGSCDSGTCVHALRHCGSLPCQQSSKYASSKTPITGSTPLQYACALNKHTFKSKHDVTRYNLLIKGNTIWHFTTTKFASTKHIAS